jgi:hypothetical protein
LHLSEGKILPVPPNTAFLHLIRLVLGRNVYLTNDEWLSTTFVRSTFPSLRHLSLIEFRPLYPLDQLLGSLSPQLTTLAIYEPHHSSFGRLLAKLEHCQHLALHLRIDDLRQFFRPNGSNIEDRSTLRLETLHLGSGELTSDDLRSLFANEGEGGRRIKAERFILYGQSDLEAEERTKWEGIVKRKNGRIEFRDFDGR